MKSILANLFRISKSRDGMYEVTPRKLLKTLRHDLVESNRKDIASIPEDIYFTVVKMFPDTPTNKKLELAEAIDSIFLNLPDGGNQNGSAQKV